MAEVTQTALRATKPDVNSIGGVGRIPEDLKHHFKVVQDGRLAAAPK